MGFVPGIGQINKTDNNEVPLRTFLHFKFYSH